MDRIKNSIRNWLEVQKNIHSITITDKFDFETHSIRNRIWYRGDSDELQQLYSQINDGVDRYKFWSGRATPGQEIRKIHTGIPSLIINTLSSIVVNDLNEFKFTESSKELLWEDMKPISDDELRQAIADILVIGDGAFKVIIDTNVSEYPMVEWFSGERVEFAYEYGRVKEIIFKSPYKVGSRTYTLNEIYGYGYIANKLYDGEKEIHTADFNRSDLTFDKTVILATPLKHGASKKYTGRGSSVYDGKLDNFDALDEIWSQWVDAVRSGRMRTYIPESLLPHDPYTGEVMKPNPFDNRFFKTDSGIRETGAEPKIATEQGTIQHDSYLASYVSALDLCLQGLISPSTLGIDVKKLDNAEAQREKEKTTLYTRGSIINSLAGTLPKLIQACFDAYNTLYKLPLEEVKVDVTFGEYANPSFESQVETISKARTGGIMSLEASIEEMYGDSRSDEWKDKEVKRLKEELGLGEVEEPALNLEGVDVDGT